MTAKISNPFKKTEAAISEPNPNDFNQNTSKSGFFSRLRSKSPFSKKSDIKGEIETEPEPIKNSVSNVNLSEQAPVLAAAAGVNTVRNNIKANAEKAAAEREVQSARPVALPNNNAEDVSNPEEEGAPNPEKGAANPEEDAPKSNNKENAEPAANNHKKACSCEECNAIKEAKKNCSKVRKFLRLCNNSNETSNNKKKSEPTNTTTPAQNSDKTKPPPAQNGNKTPMLPSGELQKEQAQVPAATAQDVAGLLTWLQTQLQQNPIDISRIIGQLAIIIGNPSQLEPWKVFIERLKGIQADPNPQSQQAKLAQLGNETWGPAASSAPPAPAPANIPVKGGSRHRRRARRHTRKMKRCM